VVDVARWFQIGCSDIALHNANSTWESWPVKQYYCNATAGAAAQQKER
jgi:hypothetical protein